MDLRFSLIDVTSLPVLKSKTLKIRSLSIIARYFPFGDSVKAKGIEFREIS